MTWLKDFERDGVALVKGVFRPSEMSEIRLAAYASLEAKNPAYKGQTLETTVSGRPAILFWPALVSPVLDRFRTDERLAGIIRTVLGEEVKQLNNQVYFRESGDGDEFAWHQDVTFRRPRERYPGIENAYLQLIIAVDPVTKENGAVEFIPGSHLWGERTDLADGFSMNSLRSFDRHGLKGIHYEANPGDVLLWSVMTVHASEPNRSGKSRMTYMGGFARADAVLDWPYYLKDGQVQPIDPTLIP